jgi:hypothetical protein
MKTKDAGPAEKNMQIKVKRFITACFVILGV